MRGYLWVVDRSPGKVPIESRTEVYRDPNGTQQVLAATTEQTHELGVSDPTVSRRKNGQAPIEIVARDDCLEIRNERNTNGVTVRTKGDEVQLEKGYVERIRRDASVEIGYQTELRVTVERDARVEVHGGDYVAGDKREENTVIEDSVVNRSNVGTDPSSPETRTGPTPTKKESSTTIEDSVVNRSNVGGDPGGPRETDSDDPDTKEFCEDHQRAYTDVCPECAGREPASSGSRSSTGDPDETKFCMYCGTEIPMAARVCPACDAEL